MLTRAPLRLTARYRFAVAAFVLLFAFMQGNYLHRHVFDHAHDSQEAGAHEANAHSAYDEPAHAQGTADVHDVFAELDINPGGIAKFVFPLLFAWLIVVWAGAPLFLRWIARASPTLVFPRRLRALIAPPLRAPPR